VELLDYIGYLPLQLALSLVVAVASIILFRHSGGWPGILLVVGSVGYLLVTAQNTFFMYATEHNWISLQSRLWEHWSVSLFFRISGLASLCFPVGFLWFALRASRASNQAMQRTAPRSDA
jgi:hypothetical protein